MKEKNIFFAICGYISCLVSLGVLYMLVSNFYTYGSEGFFRTFIFFIFFLGITVILLSLGDKSNIPFLAHYYGLALMFLSIGIYLSFSIDYISDASPEDEYFYALFMIIIFGLLGLFGFYDAKNKKLILPYIIPYCFLAIGMIIIIYMAYKYIYQEEEFYDYTIGETFLFALGAVIFYTSGKYSNLIK